MDILKRLKLAIAVLLILFVTSPSVFSSNIKVIENPEPTMKENNISRLVKVGEIGPEVGTDKFIFSPISFVIDDSENLFVFDRMQSEMVKLDAQGKFVKSFGGQGEGPGEFAGKGRSYMVFLTLGIDNLIYANDTHKFKVMAFNREGKYLSQQKYKKLILDPTVDGNGNLIFYESKNGILKISNNKGEVFYSYPIGEKKIQYLFKDTTIKTSKTKNFIQMPRKSPYQLSMSEIQLKMTREEKLLLYFPKSAKLLVIKDKKLLKEIKIWPTEALKLFKSRLSTEKKGSTSLFLNFFLDSDDHNFIYLRYSDRKNRINRLYRVNLQGKLLSVLNIDKIGDEGYLNIFLEKNGKYYAKYDDKIIILKEVNK